MKLGVVLGCPRSGTTFLAEVLQALSHAESVSGRIFPPHVAHIVNAGVSEEVYLALQSAFRWAMDDFAGFTSDSRGWWFAEALRGNMGVGELARSLPRKRRLEAIILKEPFLAFAPRFVYDSLSTCRIVHIHRDGRDCADSLVRTYDVLTDDKLASLSSVEAPIGRKWDHRYVPWWVAGGEEDRFLATSPYVRAVWMWKEVVSRCHDFFSSQEVSASGRVLTVRYESLMTDPVTHGAQIIDHLQLRANRRVLARLRRAHTRSIGVHERRDAAEVDEAARVARRELQIYGYL